MSITCPKCHMVSHNHNDEKWRWCGNCEQYHMALVKKEPIFFDAIIERLLYAVKTKLGDESFKISHETYEDHGMIWWKSFIAVGTGIAWSSHRHHTCAGDSLRELAENVDLRI